MNEIERILRTFSPSERELWHALYGAFPVAAENQVVAEWAQPFTPGQIASLDRRQQRLAAEVTRHFEREAVRKRLEQRRRKKAA